MADIFQEVEEQLRSDRYKTLALKALPWVGGILVLALVIALAIWGYGENRARTDARASEAYDEALTSLKAGDNVKAFGQFEAVGKAGSKAYRTLALMQQAGIRLGDNKTAEAVALFDEAAKAAPSEFIGDAARLQAAYALMDTANAAEINGRLNTIAAEGRPYRMLAREALAMTKLANNQTAAAREDFTALANGLDTPAGVRQRAKAAEALIDSGNASSLKAIIKAAQAMPAMPVPSTPQAGAAQ